MRATFELAQTYDTAFEGAATIRNTRFKNPKFKRETTHRKSSACTKKQRNTQEEQ